MENEKKFYKMGDLYFEDGKKVANKIMLNEDFKKQVTANITNFKTVANIIIDSFHKYGEINKVKASIVASINSEFNIFLNKDACEYISKEIGKIKIIKTNVKEMSNTDKKNLNEKFKKKEIDISKDLKNKGLDNELSF